MSVGLKKQTLHYTVINNINNSLLPLLSFSSLLIPLSVAALVQISCKTLGPGRPLLVAQPCVASSEAGNEG